MKALGMESGAIADSQITASSEWNVYHSSKRSRLYTKDIGIKTGRGAWSSLTSDLNQWLQVDLGKITPVTHVATQGRSSWSPVQMVTKYKLQFSDDGASFLFYKRQGESSDAVNSYYKIFLDTFVTVFSRPRLLFLFCFVLHYTDPCHPKVFNNLFIFPTFLKMFFNSDGQKFPT